MKATASPAFTVAVAYCSMYSSPVILIRQVARKTGLSGDPYHAHQTVATDDRALVRGPEHRALSGLEPLAGRLSGG